MTISRTVETIQDRGALESSIIEGHSIDWSTATVEAGGGQARLDFTLRVKLRGEAPSAEWKGVFLHNARPDRLSFGMPWGSVDLDEDTILVEELAPERDDYFIALLFRHLSFAVALADNRDPTGRDAILPKGRDEIRGVGGDVAAEPEQRAAQLTQHLRAQGR